MEQRCHLKVVVMYERAKVYIRVDPKKSLTFEREKEVKPMG